jgi:transcriptional regulator with XRE-family HTH domain
MDVRKLRRAADVTQQELAHALGVAISTVSNWELGVTVPPLDKARKVAQLFNVSLDSLTFPAETKQRKGVEQNAEDSIGSETGQG